MSELTFVRLREVLHYAPVTGLFRWRVRPSNRVRVDDVAGCLHKLHGYIYIGIDGRIYRAHRLAWLWVHGVWPTHGVDHRDGDPANNRLANLRAATQAENMQNQRRAHRCSQSGYLGVQRKRNGKWIARVKRGGVHIDSQPFATPQEAHAAYIEIKAQLHPFSTLKARPHV